MIYEPTYDYLAEKLKPRLGEEERLQVYRAFEIAEAAHAGQMRDEGTPYIVHPLRVAISLVDEIDLYSPRLICSALLHDVIEDSDTTREQIAAMFGEEVAHVVWLLTKFDDTDLADYLRAIEAASSTGAPLVKLCDRLDNLRFLTLSPRIEKKRRYIRATETYYIPLAARTNRYLHEEMLRWLEKAREHVESELRDRR
ncbi:MAG: HD domain-containing protein [Blastocatellia bacterium]|nr:HD domain-containing protein [Blastocatellia bacterium]